MTERKSVPFLQDVFELDVQELECVDTGKRFTTQEMDDEFAKKLQKLWRDRYKMMQQYASWNPVYKAMANLQKLFYKTRFLQAFTREFKASEILLKVLSQVSKA